MLTYRIENDAIGERQIPKEAYYGIQSLRGQENFSITRLSTHPEMIRSLATIKKACALTNQSVGKLSPSISQAICQACDDLINGLYHDSFIVDLVQGGAGTSLNMNANEVIANRAIEYLGGQKGDYQLVHPLDHVNFGQSTNDVIPTAGKITAIRLIQQLLVQLKRLHQAFLLKSHEFDSIIKMGRTQLQDAVPIRLGQEFAAYASVIGRDIDRLEKAKDSLKTVNLGGTAIGTGLNANPDYYHRVVPCLATISGLAIRQSADLIDDTQNLDVFAFVSGNLKTCAVSLSKIANDLRLLSSGPRTGLAEINLPARQNGSSIMPGKINPVIPEVVSQVSFLVIGNDMTITMGVEAGQLELNAFEPIIFKSLFESLETLKQAVSTFVDNCVLGITANRQRCTDMVETSIGLITALAPHIGYGPASKIAKTALETGQSIRDLVISSGLVNAEELTIILDSDTMTKPGILGESLIHRETVDIQLKIQDSVSPLSH